MLASGSIGIVAPADDDTLVPTFIPALVAILHRAELDRGTPLTEAEMLEIRDSSVCMMMTRRDAEALAEGRGYDDIDPERAWIEWQEVRAQLAQGD